MPVLATAKTNFPSCSGSRAQTAFQRRSSAGLISLGLIEAGLIELGLIELEWATGMERVTTSTSMASSVKAGKVALVEIMIETA